jgi:hypothetical protein
VGTNTGISLNASATEVIGTSELSISDVDSTAAQRMIIITRVPTKGTLQARDSSNNWQTLIQDKSFFTQADIAANDVRYVNGGTSGADEFRFTVSDSEGGTIGETTFSITVNP